MRSLPRLALPAALALGALTAHAAPWRAPDTLERNGAVSRHVWMPGFASGRVAGVPVSAGLAIGLRGAVRTHLDRPVTPALNFELNPQARLSLMPGDKRSAMLVLQVQN